MLRAHAVEVSLWEAVLPEEVLRLPDELARVDALLDDPVFFAPFTPFFDPRLGRPPHADGGLPAADVPQVPLPARLRVTVPRGGRLDHLAAVLPDPTRRQGSAPVARASI